MIDEQQAIAKAREVAAEHDWAWLDPGTATLRRKWFGKGGRWEVFSHAHGHGPKVRIVLDAETGAVLDSGYIAR